MLLALIHWLADSTSLGWLRVFNYLTLRAVLAALTAFFIALALGPAVIRELRKLKVGQAVRQYGPKSHLVKEGTPTMGGILILIAVGVSTILWMDLSNRFVWVVLFVTLSFGAIGWGRRLPEGRPSRSGGYEIPRKVLLAVACWRYCFRVLGFFRGGAGE